MAINYDNKYEDDYLQVPSYKYLFLGGVAIHKRFFMFWSLVSFFGVSIFWYTLLYTAIWQNLAASMFNIFFIRFWYITLATVGLISVTGYYWNKSRVTRKRRLHEERERARNINKLIKG